MKNDIIVIIIIIIIIIINVNKVVGSGRSSTCIYINTYVNTSLPVHNALKLSDVLGQMSANSSKIILPATKNAKLILNLNQARFKSFRFEVLSNLPSFVPTYFSFYVTRRLRLLIGNLIDFNQIAKIIHKKI